MLYKIITACVASADIFHEFIVKIKNFILLDFGSGCRQQTNNRLKASIVGQI